MIETEENRMKVESRDAIIFTRDLVIRTAEQIKHIKESSEENKSDLKKHQEVSTKITNRIFSKINELKCPQEETILALEAYNTEQNGHLKVLAEQGTTTQTKLQEVLNIAKGRKSLWKEVGLVAGTVVGIVAIIASITFGIMRVTLSKQKLNNYTQVEMVQDRELLLTELLHKLEDSIKSQKKRIEE